MTVIIVDSNPDRSVVKKVICPKCGVILEYIPIDVQWTSGCVMGETESTGRIRCPNCEKALIVEGFGRKAKEVR